MTTKNDYLVAIEAKVDRAAFGVVETARALGICADTVRRMINKRELKAVRVGRRVLVPASELRRILVEGLE
jgi:excisionase family DNA binding protein